jgi:hypothetical protein
VLGSENIWLDQSGLNNHATQLTGTLQPLLVQNTALNNRPVMRFNGTSQYFNLADFMGPNAAAGLPAATAGEVFVVLKHSAAIGVGQYLWRMGAEDSNYYAYPTHYPFSDGIIYDSFGTTTRQTTGKPAQDLSAYHLYNVVSRAGEWTSRINGVLHYTTATNTFTLPAGAELGASVNYYGGYFNGDVAEIIIYDHALTSAERERVQWYLAAKYLIPDYDLDGDGLTNAQEAIYGSNPFNPDTNGDGISDGVSVAAGINPVTGTSLYPDPNGPPPTPTPNPNDHTGPIIILLRPKDAVLLP